MSESGLPGQAGDYFVLAEGLRAFKAGPLSDDPSDRALARAAGVSPTTIGDWLRGKRFPQDVSKVLIVVRMVRAAAAARGIAGPDDGPPGLLDDDRWRAAHREEARRRAGVVSDEVRRAQAISALAGPAARVRVGDADPRRLGVHAAITVPGVPDEVPPEYVPRDADAGEFGVRARVTGAARQGGFVLLVGGSSVGKTRCALETVRALLPDWWLVHPAGPAEVAELAQVPPRRTVIWLDELQRFLDGEHGLTGGMMRALLNAPHPVVIISTLWPDRYATYTALPAPGSADRYAREREVLDLATTLRIAPIFTPAEQDRARAAAARDPRLRVALESSRYGLTQTLAAAPQLVARWEDAQTVSPYGWAVLTAALDAARLGARAPLSADFLRAAAPGYCTSQQQAEAPEKWFELAMAYAAEKLHGAVAALSPVGAGMSQIAGYTVADYLIQFASRERRSVRMPATTWESILSHVGDPADAARLADSARDRLLYCYAVPLYRHAADVGDRNAALGLALLLVKRGDRDGLRARVDVGDGLGNLGLDLLLAQDDDVDGLRARADIGDTFAAWQLAELLAKRADTEQLRTRANAGDGRAAVALAELLAERGDLDGAEHILCAPADEGDGYAALRLAELLAERGDLNGAEHILRAPADNGDQHAALGLAGLLAERGDTEQLRTRANAGDKLAAWRLAGLLAQRGDLDQLRTRADAGDWNSAGALAGLLAERGGTEELGARADAGDQHAASCLAGLLAERGDTEQLRIRANAGDGHAAVALADLLTERGDLAWAEHIIRAEADNGNKDAAEALADLLTERGDLDGLRARADAGDDDVGERLAELLIKQGRNEEAQRLRRFGLNPDGSIAFA
jgi:hypothetical protein